MNQQTDTHRTDIRENEGILYLLLAAAAMFMAVIVMVAGLARSATADDAPIGRGPSLQAPAPSGLWDSQSGASASAS